MNTVSAYLALPLMGLPALAGAACEREVAAFRDASAYIWADRQVGPNVIDSGWADYDRRGARTPKQRRHIMTLLYAELNNLLKPDVAPCVRSVVVRDLGDAIRCVKAELRATGANRAKDTTKGLDRVMTAKAKKLFPRPIDLGEPL